MVNRASATPLVNRSIRRLAWPALRALGFVHATTRSAWRRRLDMTDVVNFQSAVSAGGDPIFLGPGEDGRDVEAALGSFSVNVGTYYTVRRHLPWRPCVYACPRDAERPEEFECDERLRLDTALGQSYGYPPEMWPVRSLDPRDAELAVADAVSAVQAQAVAWFEEVSNLERAFRSVERVCWGLARDLHREVDKFFQREDLFAALAIRTDRTEEALRLFQTLVARSVSSVERADYQKAEAQRQRRLDRVNKASSLIESVPFWHDGATARVAALEARLGKR
jgi:hypothetical protein